MLYFSVCTAGEVLTYSSVQIGSREVALCSRTKQRKINGILVTLCPIITRMKESFLTPERLDIIMYFVNCISLTTCTQSREQCASAPKSRRIVSNGPPEAVRFISIPKFCFFQKLSKGSTGLAKRRSSQSWKNSLLMIKTFVGGNPLAKGNPSALELQARRNSAIALPRWDRICKEFPLVH